MREDENEEEARLVTELPKELHKRLKIQAARDEITIRELVATAIERELDRRGG